MFNVCHTRGQASIITIKRGKVESPLPANKKIVPYSGKFRGVQFSWLSSIVQHIMGVSVCVHKNLNLLKW